MREDSAAREVLAEGATLLRGFASDVAPRLMDDLAKIVEAAPFRHMVTPGGLAMSVAMTNCGSAGWVTDRSGYRYDADDPEALSARKFTALYQTAVKSSRSLSARLSLTGEEGFRAGRTYRVRVVQLVGGKEVLLAEGDVTLL